MSKPILKAENISKQYRLGLVGTGSLMHDINRWWHTVRGKEDPYLKVGAVNDRSVKATDDYVWALKDINFEVQEGEVLGIIGKNGAGKSTLLKLLSRVTSPTVGVIKSRGRIASLLEVGTGFHPELTGRENIYLNGAILGMTKAEIDAKVDEIIAFSGCEMYIDTPTKRYSSGMTVRLGFAVAAHLEPDILVVDEVLAVGDAEFQKKAIGKMQDISSGEGRTVLFVSHNMASVKQLCTRAIVLEKGGISFTGNVEEAVDFYLRDDNKKLEKELLLIDNNNRSGSGIVKFSKFEVQSINGEVINTVLSGDDILFCFEVFVDNKELNMLNLDLGFSIYKDGMALSVLYNSYQNISISVRGHGYYVVKCLIKKFPINAGVCQVRGRIVVNNEESDWIKIPLDRISVEKGDFYNTGSTGFIGNSSVLIEGEWTSYKK